MGHAFGADGFDVDVILLTDYPLAYIESDAGARDLGASAIIRTRGWGF